MTGSREYQEPSSSDLTAAIAGDRVAVTRITRLYLSRVYGLCLRISQRRLLAEEATQETFVRALRALPKLKNPASFKSWILMIAANTTRELLRKRGRERNVPLDSTALDSEEIVVTPDFASADEMDKKRLALHAALQDLGSSEREIFLLHSVAGIQVERLAEDHSTSEAAMRSRIHRIRAKVRNRAHNILRQQEGLS